MKKKFETLENIFQDAKNSTSLYKKVMEYGSTYPMLHKDLHKKEHIVQGCQSTLYLTHEFKDGKIKFSFYTEALISKGLAAIIVSLYTDEDPKHIFLHPLSKSPLAQIFSKVSMQRQTGISNLYKQMQLISTKYL